MIWNHVLILLLSALSRCLVVASVTLGGALSPDSSNGSERDSFLWLELFSDKCNALGPTLVGGTSCPIALSSLLASLHSFQPLLNWCIPFPTTPMKIHTNIQNGPDLPVARRAPGIAIPRATEAKPRIIS